MPTKKTHAHDDDKTPHPVVFEGPAAAAVDEGTQFRVSKGPPLDLQRDALILIKGDGRAFARAASGELVEVQPDAAKDAAAACAGMGEEAQRKVAADVARVYPVA